MKIRGYYYKRSTDLSAYLFLYRGGPVMSQENSNDSTVQVQGTGGILGAIERIGNRIPDITIAVYCSLCYYLCRIGFILTNSFRIHSSYNR